MGDEEDETEQPTSPPKYPFDSATTECVLDLRALCRLPQCADADGTAAFRAVLLPKGKTLHVPDEPGCYATLGPWRSQISLSLVHFVTATARKPELLLAFVDYGMLNGDATGIYIMSLQLPLQKRRNVYEESPRLTKIADISGFTPINVNTQPWCTMLEPALKRQPIYEAQHLYSPSDIITHLRIPLATRIKGLLDAAKNGIAEQVAGLAKQDERQAEKAKARMEAQLDKANEFLLALPPSKYDRRMEERIILVKPDASDGAAWLKSPQRSQLQSGEAVCQPTARKARRLEISPDIATTDGTDSAPAPAIAAAPAVAADLSVSGGSTEDSDDASDVDANAALPGAKRVRKAVRHYDPGEQDQQKEKRKEKIKTKEVCANLCCCLVLPLSACVLCHRMPCARMASTLGPRSPSSVRVAHTRSLRTRRASQGLPLCSRP